MNQWVRARWRAVRHALAPVDVVASRAPTDPADGSRVAQALRASTRRVVQMSALTALVALALSFLARVTAHPGTLGESLAAWWESFPPRTTGDGYETAALAVGLTAIPVTLFVATAIGRALQASTDDRREQARVIVIEHVVAVALMVGAVMGWLMVGLPTQPTPDGLLNVAAPLACAVLMSALCVSTGHSQEALQWELERVRQSRERLQAAVETHRAALAPTPTMSGGGLPFGLVAVVAVPVGVLTVLVTAPFTASDLLSAAAAAGAAGLWVAWCVGLSARTTVERFERGGWVWAVPMVDTVVVGVSVVLVGVTVLLDGAPGQGLLVVAGALVPAVGTWWLRHRRVLSRYVLARLQRRLAEFDDALPALLDDVVAARS